MLRALIFDFDGVILDTEVPAYRAWQTTYESFGASLPLEEWAKGIGSGRNEKSFDSYAFLEESIGHPVDREQVRLAYRSRSDALIALEGPRTGVAELILAARDAGVRLAVASSSPRGWIEGHLTRLGLLDYFAAIRCFDDVARTKPHPDLFLSALDAVGMGGNEAIAFEDSPNGILAAKRAGLFCIAVANPVTALLDLSGADLWFDSFTQIDLAMLRGAIDGSAK